MNKVYVLTCFDNRGELTVKVFRNKDDAVGYAMESLFGEDWEVQLYDDDWDEQSKLEQAYDSISEDYGYVDSNDYVWTLFECEVE